MYILIYRAIYMAKKTRLLAIIFIFLTFFFTEKVSATRFTIVAPTGTLQSGTQVPFTINIDTEGTTLTTTQTDVQLNPTYIQFQGVTPAALFPTLAVSNPSADTVRIAGTVETGTSGVNGTGTFATMIARMTATSSGTTTLASIVSLPTLTLTPTTPITPTTVIYPTNTPVVNTPPPISELPRTGTTENITMGIGIGIIFVLSGLSLTKLLTRSG